jgi:hypothetical protein
VRHSERSLAGLACAAVVLVACSTTRAHIMEASLGRHSRVLRLVVGSCNADLSAQIEESPSRVTVTVTARNNTGDDCADGLVVHLDQPLGERQLLDEVTGEVVPVQPADR